MKKHGKLNIIIIGLIILVIIGVILIYNKIKASNPAETLNQYISYVNDAKYEEMYELISKESKGTISKEDYILRNQKIYNGIEMSNMQIEILNNEKVNSKSSKITYKVNMNSVGGNISFENTANLIKENSKYYLQWSSNDIFPDLNNDEKVKVKTQKAIRGNILDRNGKVIAGQGEVYSVGLVPGKLNEDTKKDFENLSSLLGISVEKIENSLKASWVKDDSFVPLKSIKKDDDETKEKLLKISGVKLSSVSSRVYVYNEATSHLTGYVQNITAEELEEKKDKGYNSNSVIGKSGLEKSYEERLKGEDGVEVYIEDKDRNKKKTIIEEKVKNGENIKLTIDMNIQTKLYNELKDDEGFFVVMNPKTGEILALVSTPSYDANDFVLGISNEKWEGLKNSDKSPMTARYLQKWCPGSTFKPITGAIGLSTNSLSTDDIFTYNGLAWQKDASWGAYEITTLTPYSGAKNLKNALIHSDNIYFGQATLKIGKENFINGLKKIKFNEDIDFDLQLSKSQYSNDNNISSETQLADSGYGQGQILINPIHMASIYSSFSNDGNMIKPYLEYKENKNTEYLVKGAFSKEAANIIKEDLIQVVENKEGTANDMKIRGTIIAGKTGTAELKVSKDENGDELGWFDCFSIKENSNNDLLIISMVENAKSNGGSHYLIKKIKTLF